MRKIYYPSANNTVVQTKEGQELVWGFVEWATPPRSYEVALKRISEINKRLTQAWKDQVLDDRIMRLVNEKRRVRWTINML